MWLRERKDEAYARVKATGGGGLLFSAPFTARSFAVVMVVGKGMCAYRLDAVALNATGMAVAYALPRTASLPRAVYDSRWTVLWACFLVSFVGVSPHLCSAPPPSLLPSLSRTGSQASVNTLSFLLVSAGSGVGAEARNTCARARAPPLCSSVLPDSHVHA